MLNYIASHAGTIGLLFFFIFFVVMVAWLFRPGSKEIYKSHGDMPLREEDNG